MEYNEIFRGISAGLLVTDKDFKVAWANKFEENFYGKTLEEMKDMWVVDCHREENKTFIKSFLEKFKTGELKEFTKIAVGMVITYSSYYENQEFAGIVRTRIKMPKQNLK